MTDRHLRLLATTLLLAAGLAACGKPKPPANAAATTPAPVTINTLPVRTSNLQRSVRIVGSLAGLETATISNRITGIISRVYIDRGDRVTPNQKLLEIEPERFDLAKKEVEASLEQTLARLGIKEVPPENFDVNQTAPVKKAQSEYENAKSKLDRATPLNQSKVMNDFEYLDITSAYKTAESALESSRDDARALLAQARQNRTQIDMRKKDFRDAVILAPDGSTPDGGKIESYVVSDRKVSTGEYLREGTPLFTLMADGILKLQARVPERYLADVKKGAEVKFHVDAYGNEQFIGTVATVDPAVDPASRTFLVEALVDNGKYDRRLRPGSFVSGDVLTKTDAARVMVPLEAITTFVGVTKVFKLDGNSKVKSVDVVIGQQETVKDAAGKDSPWVEIATGDIKSGDRVAVSGLTKLVDGSPIVVNERPAPPERPSADVK